MQRSAEIFAKVVNGHLPSPTIGGHLFARMMIQRTIVSATAVESRKQEKVGKTVAISEVNKDSLQRALHLRWEDGTVGKFPWIWLRDTSPDTVTYTLSPAMTARNLVMRDFNVEEEPEVLGLDNDRTDLRLRWKDGVESRFGSAWLRLRNPSDLEARRKRWNVYLFPDKTWGAAEIEKNLKRFPYEDMLENDEILHDFLEAVCLDGIAVLTGAPKGKRGAVEAIGKRIGFIQKTHFGKVFEVLTKADASNMAYASTSELPFHTDFPSLENPPQLQMLHMLERAQEGGNSLFVDGFHVAEQLREERPEVFKTLTTMDAEYIEEGFDTHEADDGKSQRFDYFMAARHKVISLDDRKRIVRIQFGNAMRSWFYDCEDPLKVQDYYRAMKVFTEYCYQPRNVLRFALENGDTVLWANTRLLHTRDRYFGGNRTLTGCYFSWDIVKSRVRQLRRKLELPQSQPSA